MLGLVLPPLRPCLLRPRLGPLLVLWPLVVLLLVVVVVVALLLRVLSVLLVVHRVMWMGVRLVVLLVQGPLGRESARAARL